MKKEVKKENLKQRAYLNTITSVLDFFAKNITGFFVTPFIVTGLGSAIYGAWQILGQLTGYTNWADIRAAEVLKWSIAKDRDAGKEVELRRNVTATFIILVFVLPFILLAGSVLSWYAPLIVGIDEEYYRIIRITSLILILSLVVNKIFNVFEAILRGMNLGFKRMGIRAIIVVLGGGAKILVVLQGYGLIGLAVVQLIVAFAIGLTIYWIVKKHVPWFGFGKIELSRSKAFYKTSGWFMAWTLTKMLLLNSDKILLGYLAGPLLVAKYALTKFLADTIRGLVVTIVNGVLPGLGKLYGTKNMNKLMKGRELVMALTWLFTASIGAVVISLNASFLALWVGDDNFAGNVVSLLVVLMTIQYVFIQNDSDIINVTLDIKKKTLLALLSAVVSFGLGVFLIKSHGIAGLCLSIIIGRSILSYTYPLLIKEKLEVNDNLSPVSFRQLIVSAVLFTTVFTFWQDYTLNSWLSLLLLAPVLMVFSLFFLYFLGLNRTKRSELYDLFKQIKLFKTDS